MHMFFGIFVCSIVLLICSLVILILALFPLDILPAFSSWWMNIYKACCYLTLSVEIASKFIVKIQGTAHGRKFSVNSFSLADYNCCYCLRYMAYIMDTNEEERVKVWFKLYNDKIGLTWQAIYPFPFMKLF